VAYATLFDVLVEPYDAWGTILGAVTAMTLAVFLAIPSRFAGTHSAADRVMAALRRDIPARAALVPATLAVLMFAIAACAWQEWRELRAIASQGRGEVVAGRLDEARAWNAKKTGHERLRVGAASFEYREYQTASPYPLLRASGPLAKGTPVRITHAGGRILKVEARFPPGDEREARAAAEHQGKK